jgi:outer membrane lipoprotein-sorting protein
MSELLIAKRGDEFLKEKTRVSARWMGIAILAGICALSGGQSSAQEVRSGEDVLRVMHDKYRTDWYETLTFTQKSITHKPDGTSSSEIWHEAAMVPGKLRIDIGPVSEGNGILVADGALTSFKDGKVSGTRPFVHMLLVLGFDIYKQDPKVTIEEVKGQGFDLTKVHEEDWAGKAVYVVGADKGDLKSKQFWVEKKSLLFVRMIEPDKKDLAKTNDTRFVDYRKLPVGWVAAGVEFYVDGKLVFTEEYSEIEANPKLDAAVFDAKQFGTAHWEK